MSIGQWSHEDFIAQVLKFHGHAAPRLIGGYMVEKARCPRPGAFFSTPFPKPCNGPPDAVQMLTPWYRGHGLAAHPQFRHLRASLYDKHGRGRAGASDVDS